MTIPDPGRREALISALMAVDGYRGPFAPRDGLPRYDLYADAILAKEAEALAEALAEIERLKGWINAKHLCWELEYSQGAHFVWIVWALKPGVAHVAAICTTEVKADKYMADLPEHGGLSYRGSKMWKERVPLDHAFGWKDSVAAMIAGGRP